MATLTRYLVLTVPFITGLLFVISKIDSQYSSAALEMKESMVAVVPRCQIDWKLIHVDGMTASQVFEYLHWSNSSSCRVAFDFGGEVRGPPERRGIDGQKTVCMDPGVRPNSGNCLVYSFGINNEWSFDRTFGKYGCQVFAFDPSMAMNDSNYAQSVYKELEAKHGNVVIDYLKIDIEGHEWNSLKEIIDSRMLHKVRQLGVEIHLKGQHSLEQILERVRVLKSLEDGGMVRFSSRVNVWMQSVIPAVHLTDYSGYEITWYNQQFKL